VKKDIEDLLENRCNFDYVLVNYYRDGKDYIGFHADNEASGVSPTHGAKNIVASISLGQPRRFLLRHKKKKLPQLEYSLTPGSLIVMEGETQTFWKHSVPKELRVTQSRINLTFRVS